MDSQITKEHPHAFGLICWLKENSWWVFQNSLMSPVLTLWQISFIFNRQTFVFSNLENPYLTRVFTRLGYDTMDRCIDHQRRDSYFLIDLLGHTEPLEGISKWFFRHFFFDLENLYFTHVIFITDTKPRDR